MNCTTTLRRRQHCWAAALGCMLEPANMKPNARILYSAGEVFADRHIADLGMLAITTPAPILYLVWNRSWPACPTQIVALLPRKNKVSVIGTLMPWAASDDPQMILVETSGDRAYRMTASGQLRPCPRPDEDLEGGIMLAIGQIGRIATEFNEVMPQYPHQPPSGAAMF